MYKLIATDIDGTLINSKRILTENTKEVLKEASDNGIVIMLCSGRAPVTLDLITDQLDIDMPLACYNGAQILSGKNGKVLYQKGLDKEDAILTYKEGCKRNVGVIIWTLDGKIAFNEKNRHTKHYLDNSNYKDEVLYIGDDLSYFDDKDNKIAKLLWQDDPEKVEEEHIPYSKELLKGTNAISATSQSFLLEFTHKNANKAEAIKQVAKAYNIKHEDTIGIGDGLNDIPMIEYASLGVAMKNAHKDVLKIADIVAPSNDEEGVAYIINKYMLGKE